MVESLLGGRLGVDIIPLLAPVGAVVVGEYLAGTAISVMLASGQGGGEWASATASSSRTGPVTSERSDRDCLVEARGRATFLPQRPVKLVAGRP